MATYTLRPTAYVSGVDYTTWSGQASNAALASAFGDNADGTLATKSGAPTLGQQNTIFTLSAPTIATNEFVVRAGHFVRWKGGDTSGGEQLGTFTFRTSDTTPSYAQTFATDGRSTATTTEVGYSSVTWSVADCSSLRSIITTKRNNPSPILTVYEIGSTIYTLALATCTVSNQTSTTTPKPTIPVSVTVPIGFESSEAQSSNLRRVVTQVRIESGGTGVGTGTLVAYNYIDAFYQNTGTVNVPTTTSLANGTYSIYARATRFRDGQNVDQALAATDQSGAWVTATLTINNPLPTAPTITPTVDSTNKRIGLAVSASWTAGVYGPSTIELQKSIDAGSTWTAVRTSPVSPRQNLILNPSFEVDTSGWSASTGTIARSTTFANNGSASAVLANAAGGSVVSNSQTTNSAIVTAGLTYTASAYFRATAASRTGRVDLVWQTSTGSVISTTSGTATALTSGAWVRVSVTGTAPNNATNVYLTIASPSTLSPAESLYVDGVLLEQSSTVNSYLDFIASTTIYDYEMPRGTSTLYRTRITAYSVGYPTASAFVTTSGQTLALTSDWSLKHPTNPSLNLVNAQITDTPTEEILEDLGVFRPLDRRYPVVVAGSLGGWDGTLEIVTTSAAEWTSLKALLEAQAILYLESAFGGSKYIRIVTGAKTEMLGTQTSPRRRVTVEYVEVQAP